MRNNTHTHRIHNALHIILGRREVDAITTTTTQLSTEQMYVTNMGAQTDS